MRKLCEGSRMWNAAQLYRKRVLKLYDGVRHEGQDWGLDHSPEIDPFAAGAMHVVKGASGVRYGPDAIAGVLLPPDCATGPMGSPLLVPVPALAVARQKLYSLTSEVR